MRDPKNPDLEVLFQDLQETETARVPDFRSMMDQARAEAAESGPGAIPVRQSRVLPKRLAWGGSLLAAAAAAVLILIQVPATSDAEFVQVVQAYSSNPAAGAWASPTDGLLNVPGNKILSTMPSIGTNRRLLDPGSEPQRNEL